MKPYIKNVIMIMSGGIGARFGKDCPKQYNNMNGRPVIDYAVDACRRSTLVDEIVIVASETYVDYVRDRFNVPAVAGGSTRPGSVAQGLKYVHEHYDCEKLIITNAVCPLASAEQFDRYFELLDEFDYVLTTWKLAPALHRFDGQKVDRDEFFNIMEPDAYRFKTLYQSFDFEQLKKYIFHNMPDQARPYYCFDYPYTTKVTYPFDIPVLEALYDLLIEKPKLDRTLQQVGRYLSSDGTVGIEGWIGKVQEDVKEIAHKYGVVSYTVNSQTQANIVYEGKSVTHGDIIIKFSPSEYDYHKELTYYKLSSPSVMACLIGSDDQDHALIIEKIKPGIQVKFHVDDLDLRGLYERINESFIPCDKLQGDAMVPHFIDEFEKFSQVADHYTFEYEYRKSVEQKARRIWAHYFEDAPQYYLHGDIQRRNILNENGRYRVIDPRGTIGPKEFEYVIQFITELREDLTNRSIHENYETMLMYFGAYADIERLKAALYVFWVHKLNDYIFHKNDNCKLAAWCKDCLQTLFFHDSLSAAMDADCAPDGIEMVCDDVPAYHI